jgi:hypothetical protein
MTDILRVENEYYVRATSALADDRTRVLKDGDTFAVFNRYVRCNSAFSSWSAVIFRVLCCA